MKNSRKLITIFLLLISITMKSQEIITISKSDVLAKISENNLMLKISKEVFNTSKADYRQTNAIFLPNITASHTGIITTNPLMAFGSKLNQEILTAADFNPVLLNNPNQTQSFATKIEIQQPLINMDGVYQRKAAKAKMQARFLQTERASDYLILEVEKAYMQLQLAHKGVAVLKKGLKAAKANKELAVNNFKKGYLQRADVLLVEVRVTEVKNQLQTAKSNVQNASDYLSFLMNNNNYVVYNPTDSLTLNSQITITGKISNNRSDIKAMSLVSDAYQAINKAEKMSFLPKLNAFGSYELYDNKIFHN